MPVLGRLEIYWPDSPVESFILTKPVIAIGRSSGNDLVVDRNGVSRYHATLNVEEQQALLTDLESVNGVYVDGVRIKANEPFVLRGGEEVQLADVRLVFYPAELSDDTLPTSAADTQYIETEQFRVVVTEPEFAVVPGSHAQAAIDILNLTEETKYYTLQIEGIPREWVRLERSEAMLDAGEETRIHASFKPARRSETRPGKYPITYIVSPKDKPEAAVRINSSLTIGAYSGYGAVMAVGTAQGNQPFHMYVHNQGNAQLALRFRGVDPQSALRIKLNPPRVTLAAGERRTVYGSVSPKRGILFGSPQQYTFDVIALAEDPSGFQAPLSGVYLAKPLMPAWSATLAIPLVAVLVVGLIILVASLLGKEEEKIVPQITAFSAASEEVVLGSPITLQWNVSDARRVSIVYARPDQMPQEVVVEAPATSNTYQLLLQTSGIYTVTLTAENSGGTQSHLLTVRVRPNVVDLKAEPDRLLEGVLQEVKLSWAVSGAASDSEGALITLNSPELDAIQASSLPEQGSRTYRIRPLGEVSVILEVTGQDGTKNSRTLKFAVEQPRCLLSNPSAAVYEGPGQVYRVLSKIEEAGAVINPLGRSEDNTWLQVPYQNRVAWVRVADFACEGFGVSALAPVTDIPPTPIPTATATPTASPTATFTPTFTPTRTPTRTPPPPTFTPQPTPTRRR